MRIRFHLHRIVPNVGPPSTVELTDDQFKNNCVALREVLKFGRFKDNDIVLGDESSLYISRNHAELHQIFDDDIENFTYHVEDLSENGTYVNDRRLKKGQKYRLKLGQVIKFGHPNGISIQEGQDTHQPNAEFAFRVELSTPRCAANEEEHPMRVFPANPAVDRSGEVSNMSGRSTEYGVRTREADSTNEVIGVVPQMFGHQNQPTTSQWVYPNPILAPAACTISDVAFYILQYYKRFGVVPQLSSAEQINKMFNLNVPIAEALSILQVTGIPNGNTDFENQLLICSLLRCRQPPPAPPPQVVIPPFNLANYNLQRIQPVVRSDADSSGDPVPPLFPGSGHPSPGTSSPPLPPPIHVPFPMRLDLDFSYYRDYLAHLNTSAPIADVYHSVMFQQLSRRFPNIPVEQISATLLPSLAQLRDIQKDSEAAQKLINEQSPQPTNHQRNGVIVNPIEREDFDEIRNSASSGSTTANIRRRVDSEESVIDVVSTDEPEVREESESPMDQVEQTNEDVSEALNTGDSHTITSASVSPIFSTPTETPEDTPAMTPMEGAAPAAPAPIPVPAVIVPKEEPQSEEPSADQLVAGGSNASSSMGGVVENIQVNIKVEVMEPVEQEENPQEEMLRKQAEEEEKKRIEEEEEKKEKEKEAEELKKKMEEEEAKKKALEEEEKKKKEEEEKKKVEEARQLRKKEAAEKKKKAAEARRSAKLQKEEESKTPAAPKSKKKNSKAAEEPLEPVQETPKKKEAPARRTRMKQLGDVSSVDSDSDGEEQETKKEEEEPKKNIRKSLRSANPPTPSKPAKQAEEDQDEEKEEEEGSDIDAPKEKKKKAAPRRKAGQAAKARKPEVSEDDEGEAPPKKQVKKRTSKKAEAEEKEVVEAEEAQAKSDDDEEKNEEEPVEEDPKDLCGRFDFCIIERRRFANVNWVCCSKCQQWWHVYCARGNNVNFKDDEEYQCTEHCGKYENLKKPKRAAPPAPRKPRGGRGKAKNN